MSVNCREYYNRWGKDYDGYMDRVGWLLPARISVEILDYTQPPFRKFLDIGVGTGLFGKELRDKGICPRQEHYNLYGIDISGILLEIARKKDIYSHLFLMDAEKLNFPDETFDAVGSCGVFGLIGTTAFKEALRVTKKDGILAISIGSFPTQPERNTHFDTLCTFIKSKTNNIRVIAKLNFECCYRYHEKANKEHYILYLLQKISPG